MKTINLKIVLIFLLITVFPVYSQEQEGTSPECTRAKPTPILSRGIFLKRSFRLKKNKSYPFEYIGFETARLKNGDNLIIRNYGCHNYSLSFRFQTRRFSDSVGQTRLWYKNAVKLISPVSKTLNDSLIINGSKALNSYIKNNKTLKFAEILYFDGKIIESVVSLDKPKKLKGNRFEIEISFGIGPL